MRAVLLSTPALRLQLRMSAEIMSLYAISNPFVELVLNSSFRTLGRCKKGLLNHNLCIFFHYNKDRYHFISFTGSDCYHAGLEYPKCNVSFQTIFTGYLKYS